MNDKELKLQIIETPVEDKLEKIKKIVLRMNDKADIILKKLNSSRQ